MSLSASLVIAVILAVRLIIKKAPKKWSYLLWSAAAFRLCCPISLGTGFSIFRLIPSDLSSIFQKGGVQNALDGAALSSSAPLVSSVVHQTPDIGGVLATQLPASTALPTPPLTASPIGAAITGAPVADTAAPALMPGTIENIGSGGASALSLSAQLVRIAAIVWLMGIAAIAVYALISYVVLRRRLVGSMQGREKGVFCSDSVDSPFILGIVKPRIYIPFGLSDEAREYVLAHENQHIKRGDHIVKALSFVILAVHWFNPLCWLAFLLMSRDMEMSCDEKVLSVKDGINKPYSRTLLSFASPTEFPKPNPLAFSESGVKMRIKNALKYKKPKLFISIIAGILCIFALIACVSDPSGSGKTTEPPIINIEFPPAKSLDEVASLVFSVPTGDGGMTVSVHTDDGEHLSRVPEAFCYWGSNYYILNSADERTRTLIRDEKGREREFPGDASTPSASVLVYSSQNGNYIRKYSKTPEEANAWYTHIAVDGERLYLLDAYSNALTVIDEKTGETSIHRAGKLDIAGKTVNMYAESGMAVFIFDNGEYAVFDTASGKFKKEAANIGYTYKTETLGRAANPLFTVFDRKTGAVVKTALSPGERAEPVFIDRSGNVCFIVYRGNNAIVKLMDDRGTIMRESEEFDLSGSLIPKNLVFGSTGGRAVTILRPCEDRIDIMELPLNAIIDSSDDTPVEFSDPAFEKFIRENTSLGDENEPITQNDLLRITLLHFGRNWGFGYDEIKDFSDLAKFKNLEMLWIRTDNITDLEPIASLTKLIELDIWSENVSDLSPLSGLSHLRSLYIRGGGMSDLSPLDGLSRLEELHANSCGISELSSFPMLTSLETLYLRGNRIAEVSSLAESGKLPSIKHLYLIDNLISDPSPLSALKTLETLDLSGNPCDQNAVEALKAQLENCSVTVSEDDTKVARWGVDLSGDGAAEYFCLNISELRQGAALTPWVEDASGNLLGELEPIGFAHAASNNYLFVDKPGIGKCIMMYKPGYGSGGKCYYSYELYNVQNGKLERAFQSGVEFSVRSMHPDPDIDIEAVLAFVDEVNSLMEYGRLVFSADDLYGLTRYGLYDYASGERFDMGSNSGVICRTGADPAAFSSRGYDADMLISTCIITDSDILCRESLGAIELELSAIAGYPANGSMRDKLEFANYLHSRSRAIILAGQYNEVSDYSGIEIVDEEPGGVYVEGQRRYLIYVPMELMPFDESTALSRRYVHIVDDRVIATYSDPSEVGE